MSRFTAVICRRNKLSSFTFLKRGDIVMKGYVLYVDSVFRRKPDPYTAPQMPSCIWPQMAYMPISDPTAAAAALIQASLAARVALEVRKERNSHF